jgi:hypothetical protein
MSGFLRAFAPLALCLAALMGSAPSALAQMRFTAVPIPSSACGDRCPMVIQAEGRITRDSASDFVAFAKQASDQGRLVNIVLIHSPGGSVVGSMMLGQTFRTLGTTVVVARVSRGGGIFSGPPVDARTGRTIPPGALTNATCNSACVYAVMGGRKRVIPTDSRMGVHRMQSEENYGFDPVSNRAVSNRRTGSENEVTALKRYTRYMGVDPRLIDLAESIPHEDIRVLSAEQVRSFRLGQSKLQ